MLEIFISPMVDLASFFIRLSAKQQERRKLSNDVILRQKLTR